MSIIQTKTAIPGLREANKLLADIKKLGIDDVEPMYDAQVGLWGITQVFKPSGRILLMNTNESFEAIPNLMWWCRTPDMKFRTPNDQDLHDIVVTVKRAQTWFDKGSDAMVDEIEKQEKEQYDKNREAQSKKIRDSAPALKKYIKKELL